MNYPNHFIESYVHNGGIGVLIELGFSDSATSRSEVFTRLAKDLALHIAAMAPASIEDLLQQPSVADISITVGELISRADGNLDEKIAVLRFVRWSTNPQDALQPGPPRSPAVIYDLRSVG